jgi:hypothetical protein
MKAHDLGASRKRKDAITSLRQTVSFSTARNRHLSEGRSTVNIMNAAEHWQAWLDRYGADYATDEERRAAYRDFKANLADYTERFSAGDDL